MTPQRDFGGGLGLEEKNKIDKKLRKKLRKMRGEKISIFDELIEQVKLIKSNLF